MMTPSELAYIVELEEQIKQQAAVIEQMRYWGTNLTSSLCGEERSKDTDYWYGYALGTLALKPCPKVLNKVRADAVRKFAEDELDNPYYSAAMNYAQRIAKGEA